MELDIDRVTILYGVGVLLGVAAAFYFGFRLLEDLSPTTTAVMLFLGFVVFLVVGATVERAILDTVSYALAAGLYIVFVGYLLVTFQPGDVGMFLLLAGSSAMFIGLGYLAYEERLEVHRRHAKIAVVVLLLLGAALVVADVLGPQPTTTAEFESSIEVPQGREATTVGTVTVENEFLLSRSADLPRYGACLYTPEGRLARLRYADRPAGDVLLSGRSSRTFDLVVESGVFYGEGDRSGELQTVESIPVETAAECPQDAADVRLVVVQGRVEPPRIPQ